MFVDKLRSFYNNIYHGIDNVISLNQSALTHQKVFASFVFSFGLVGIFANVKKRIITISILN